MVIYIFQWRSWHASDYHAGGKPTANFDGRAAGE